MAENLINIEAAIKAAESGDAEAQYYLGRLYWEGDEVVQNYNEAVKWLKLAAEQGNKGACHLLGVCYKHGQGLPKDEVAAEAWFNKSEKNAKPVANNAVKPNRICKNCGEQLSDGSSFCDECGEEYNDSNNDIKKANHQPAANKKTVDEILVELAMLVGLTEVKKAVRNIIQKIKFEKKRAEMTGKDASIEGNHIVLAGNPGTGKTMLAFLLVKLFKAAGILTSDNLVEIQGFDLKGAYIGLSSGIVNKYCDEAMGSVLFIDEAYALTNENGPVDEYAHEAISTLLARLENDKNKFICIAAGYHKEMETFLNKSNPGMRRRFTHFINLPDYTAEELMQIFEQLVKKDGFTLSSSAKEKAREIINKMSANRDSVFGNAREMIMLFEKTMSKQAQRICSLPEDQQNEAMMLIEAEDIG